MLVYQNNLLIPSPVNELYGLSGRQIAVVTRIKPKRRLSFENGYAALGLTNSVVGIQTGYGSDGKWSDKAPRSHAAINQQKRHTKGRKNRGQTVEEVSVSDVPSMQDDCSPGCQCRT